MIGRQNFGALASFSGPSSNCCAGDAWDQGSDRGCTRRGPKRLTLRVLRGLRNADEQHLLPITEAALQPSAVAAADFCAVALRFPHRVEFRCAGSHYKSKVVWSEMPSNFLQSVYTAIKIADIGTYRCGTSQPNDGGSPGFMMCISNSHFCSARVA
jgi:hypothetical protein